MAKQRNLGLTIFAVCCAIFARTALLAPTEAELEDPHVASRARDYGAEKDPKGLLHGLRYYVLGVAGIGLLIALEDYLLERSKKKKPNQPLQPTPPSGAAEP